MKKKLLLLLLLFIPFIVNASRIDDLKLKWSDSLGYDGYIYNPYLENDEKYFNAQTNSEHSYNKSKIIKLDDGYIIFGNKSISKYNANSGPQKKIQYNGMEYIVEDELIYVVSEDYEKNEITVSKMNYDLEILNSFSPEGEPRSMYIDGDKLIYTALNYDSQKDGYYLKNYILNKENLKLEKESYIFTNNYVYSEDKKVFSTSDNYFYIDKNFELKPQNLLNNNTYTLIYNSKIHLYNLDGTIIKSANLMSENYNIYDYLQIMSDNKIYVALRESKYNSSVQKYKNRIIYYVFDENLNVLASHDIIESDTSSPYNYYLEGYHNKNGIFIKYASKAYEITENFEFIETDSSNLYSEDNLPFSENSEPNIKLQSFEFSSYIVESLSCEMETELSENYEEVYVFPTYDTYYNETKDEFIINVTWHQDLYDGERLTYKTKTELIILHKETNFEPKKRITIQDEKITKEYYSPNNIITVTEDYIILGITTGGITKVLFYDHEYNLVKEFKSETTQKYSIQKIDYSKNSLLLVLSEIRPVPNSLLDSSGVNESEMFEVSVSVNKFKLAKVDSGFNHNGLHSIGKSMIVEYYEAPFNIVTKTDGNGTVTATQKKADRGTAVEFEVKPNEGYVLGSVKVIDNDGNVIIFTDYKFTMPSADVIIEATFIKEEKNPETSDVLIVLFVLTAIISTGFLIKNKKKLDWMK